jgi:cobalamin biosynthesis protein CobT
MGHAGYPDPCSHELDGGVWCDYRWMLVQAAAAAKNGQEKVQRFSEDSDEEVELDSDSDADESKESEQDEQEAEQEDEDEEEEDEGEELTEFERKAVRRQAAQTRVRKLADAEAEAMLQTNVDEVLTLHAGASCIMRHASYIMHHAAHLRATAARHIAHAPTLPKKRIWTP